jgi:predicted ATPase
MQRIIIRNFGPIENISLDLRDLTLLIGSQASGKSTISKNIFFFKSIRDDFQRYFSERLESGEFSHAMWNLRKKIGRKFIQFWGPVSHFRDMHLEFAFSHEKKITLSVNEDGYVDTEFSQGFQDEFYEIRNRVSFFSKGFNSIDEESYRDLERRRYYAEIKEFTDALFEDDKKLIFIPPGRSLVTVLSDQLTEIDPKTLDFLTQNFIERVNNSKKFFSRSPDEMINDKLNFTDDLVNERSLALAKEKIYAVLKSRYVYGREGEKLFFDDGNYTKINFSSSGQQEVIWILNLIFIHILDNRKVFIVFEEPEAHLYPEAQKAVSELIALLANNSEGNQVLITTHSPYILSSFNNLLYAHAVAEKGRREEVSALIDEPFHLASNNVSALKVGGGSFRSIIDEDEKLIRTEEIDEVSAEINDTFEKLFDLDNLNG